MVQIPGKPFSDILPDLDNGQIHYDLTEGLYNMTAAVADTRKPGTITLTIKFTPTGKGTVQADAKVKIDLPEHDRSSTTFFVGKDFSLQRKNPDQHELPLREVEMPNNAPRVVES